MQDISKETWSLPSTHIHILWTFHSINEYGKWTATRVFVYACQSCFLRRVAAGMRMQIIQVFRERDIRVGVARRFAGENSRWRSAKILGLEVFFKGLSTGSRKGNHFEIVWLCTVASRRCLGTSRAFTFNIRTVNRPLLIHTIQSVIIFSLNGGDFIRRRWLMSSMKMRFNFPTVTLSTCHSANSMTRRFAKLLFTNRNWCNAEHDDTLFENK